MKKFNIQPTNKIKYNQLAPFSTPKPIYIVDKEKTKKLNPLELPKK